MSETKLLITKQELIDQQFMITKKFVVIDSSLYTPEAFEYVQELINYSGSILFVSDTKKIYARGKYFGGDIFQADLLYFTTFEVYNKDNELVGFTTATRPKSTLKIKGGEHVDLSAQYNDATGESLMEINYNLSNAVNTERFTMEQNAKYNLAVVDGQIQMIKYVPANITLSSLPVLEYDSGDTEVCIKLTHIGSKPLTQMEINCSLGAEYIDLIKTTDKEIYGLVPNNTDTTFTVFFSDGETEGQTQVKQIWGYGCIYGSASIFDAPSSDTFNNFNKYIITNNPSKTVIIEQNMNEYGWFACPIEFDVTFTDSSTNLQGGWLKTGTFEYYGFNSVYQIYQTEHTGLGKNKWIITKK